MFLRLVLRCKRWPLTQFTSLSLRAVVKHFELFLRYPMALQGYSFSESDSPPSPHSLIGMLPRGRVSWRHGLCLLLRE
jgi:hypothetical protein